MSSEATGVLEIDVAVADARRPPSRVDIPIAGSLLSSAMNEIAQAIANRQSAIDRLQAEIKGLDRRRADPPCVSAEGALHVAALFLAADEGGCRGRQQVRVQAGEEAPGECLPRRRRRYWSA